MSGRRSEFPVRSFKAVGGTPRFITRAQGPYIWDVDGQRYIDLWQFLGRLDFGNMPRGRSRPRSYAPYGAFKFRHPHGDGGELAQMIQKALPSMARMPL